MLVRVLAALALAAGHTVRHVRMYGLAFASACLVCVGVATLTHHRAVGLVLAGLFGLAADHRRSV